MPRSPRSSARGGASGRAVRERDADDRRVERVKLNPEALGEVERAYRWRGQSVQEALEPLSAAELESVRLFLGRLTELPRSEDIDNPEAPTSR